MQRFENTCARSIVAPDMATAMRLFVSNLSDPMNCPYAISIDHSPSEQVDGSEWHTSALIISQSMEHQKLADELGKCINTKTNTLRQWKGSNESYRRKFHNRFFHVMKDYPILVIVVSSKEDTILANEQFFANNLGIVGCYKQYEHNGKNKYEFGPFINGPQDQPKTLIASAKHAPMAIFIASYLLRAHTFLNTAVSEQLGGLRLPFWLSVWSDKPPNDFTGTYAELMLLLLGGGNAQGKFTWGGFLENDDQPIDLLADNIAGLFNEIILKPDKNHYKGRELQPPVKGVFLWEQLL